MALKIRIKKSKKVKKTMRNYYSIRVSYIFYKLLKKTLLTNVMITH